MRGVLLYKIVKVPDCRALAVVLLTLVGVVLLLLMLLVVPVVWRAGMRGIFKWGAGVVTDVHVAAMERVVAAGGIVDVFVMRACGV